MDDADYKILFEAAMEYEATCETYDQARCEHKNEYGIARPYGKELGDCNRNAIKVRRMIEAKYGLTPKQLNEGMNLFLNRHPKGMTPELLDRYKERKESND